MRLVSCSSNSALISLDNVDKIRLSAVRPVSPSEVTREEWNEMRRTGSTRIKHPSAADKVCSSFSMGKSLGEHVSIVCRKEDEPSDAAMALMWKVAGSTPITMVSKTRPAHTLQFIPHELSFEHSELPVPAGTQFLLHPTGVDVRQAAAKAPPFATVIIADCAHDPTDAAAQEYSQHRTAIHVATLSALRPDLSVYAHNGLLPDGEHISLPSTVGVEAFQRIANLRAGGSSFMAAPLSRRDALWINQTTGQTVQPGQVIHAPFAVHGIDRALFAQWFKEMESACRQQLEKTQRIDADRLPDAVVVDTGIRTNPDLKDLRRAIRRLGPTAVFGSTGNIGSAIVETLGGKVPVTAISRNPAPIALERLSSPRHPVTRRQHLDPANPVRTVFMTASVPWRRCPQTGRILFDRAALLEDNLVGVLIPQLRTLPGDVEVLQIITNPSSDLAYAAWLLRPDLAESISAHVGTDVVRHRAHVSRPDDPDSWFTFGPHSPAQVNIDLSNGHIDENVPVLGKTLSVLAGDRSVTDPTAQCSIMEAARLHSGVPGCYGLPLTQCEANSLAEYMRNSTGYRVRVSEGIAPTLPRDMQRNIRWDMLNRAASMTGFPQRAYAALAEMENGRLQVLDCISRWAAESPDKPRNYSWIMANRDTLLHEGNRG